MQRSVTKRCRCLIFQMLSFCWDLGNFDAVVVHWVDIKWYLCLSSSLGQSRHTMAWLSERESLVAGCFRHHRNVKTWAALNICFLPKFYNGQSDVLIVKHLEFMGKLNVSFHSLAVKVDSDHSIDPSGQIKYCMIITRMFCSRWDQCWLCS